VTDHFSGPGRALGRVCVQTITDIQVTFDLWHVDPMQSSSKVNVMGQSSRSQGKFTGKTFSTTRRKARSTKKQT